MGDWEFLYDMKNEGYSDEAIMEAQGLVFPLMNGLRSERKSKKTEWEKLKSLRDSGAITKEEFKERKAEIFG